MVPIAAHPLRVPAPRGDQRPDEVTDELAYVRPADAVDADPARRARHASKQAAAYLSARRRRLRQELRHRRDADAGRG